VILKASVVVSLRAVGLTDEDGAALIQETRNVASLRVLDISYNPQLGLKTIEEIRISFN
jgi:hypothetical protein